MNEVFEWIFRELFRGVFEFLDQAVYDRLPRPVQIGCNIIGIGLIVALIAAIGFFILL